MLHKQSSAIPKLLRFLHENEESSRSDIVRALRLTKTTASALISILLANGFLLEKGEQTDRVSYTRGRRKIMLSINENHRFLLGAVIEKDRIFIGLSNLKGETLDKRSVLFDSPDYRGSLSLIAEETNKIMSDNCISAEKVQGVGLCISRGCAGFVEGNNMAERFVRLKRDLSHGIPLKIAVTGTMAGALIAQKLFGRDTGASLLMLRMGRVNESGLMTGDTVYSGVNGNLAFIEEDLSQEALLLSTQIAQLQTLVDTQKVCLLGEAFETGDTMEQIRLALQNGSAVLPQLACFGEGAIHLAGCALALDQFLFS